MHRLFAVQATAVLGVMDCQSADARRLRHDQTLLPAAVHQRTVLELAQDIQSELGNLRANLAVFLGCKEHELLPRTNINSDDRHIN